MGAESHLRTDLGQVQVHCRDVDAWQHEGRADAACGTDRTEWIGGGVALIVRCARAAAALGPDIGQAALLADARFILPPELDRLVPCMLGNDGADELGEVFLCAC
jgi:hypothetical protein